MTTQILSCLPALIRFLVPALLVLVPIRLMTKIPSFIFRKLLHMTAIILVTITITSAASWKEAALTSVILAIVLYPLLAILEKASWFNRLLVQKRAGEVNLP